MWLKELDGDAGLQEFFRGLYGGPDEELPGDQCKIGKAVAGERGKGTNLIGPRLAATLKRLASLEDCKRRASERGRIVSFDFSDSFDLFESGLTLFTGWKEDFVYTSGLRNSMPSRCRIDVLSSTSVPQSTPVWQEG